MADCSSLVQNVKNDENVAQKFPYRILNDLAKKLKAAEDQLIQERKFYEAKIAKIRAENESTRYERLGLPQFIMKSSLMCLVMMLPKMRWLTISAS